VRLVAILSFGLAFASAACSKREHEAEEGGHEAAETKQEHAFELKHEADGTAVVVATEEACEAAGLEIGAATPRDLPAIALAQGALREDPARVTVLRAPFAGELAKGDVEWPSLGAQVTAGSVVARLLPRAAPLTPAERADLQAKLADAKATRTAADAELGAARAELARVKELNAHDKGASDRAVEAAAAAVAAGEAKLHGADESVAIYAKLLAAPLSPLEPVELRVTGGGTLLSGGARLGEAVEAGAELLRVADLSQLLATVTLPAGPDLATAVYTGAIVRSDDGTSAGAAILGLAPESAPLGRTLLLRVEVGDKPLRPGQSVVAELARAGEPTHGFAVPEASLVRFGAASWIYVELEPGRLARARALVLRVAGGEALLTGALVHGANVLQGDAKIVRAGAASLLSVEQLAAGGGE
jgi:hypothetical protein